MKTTIIIFQLYIHDCSVVTPLALLFFGGVITVQQEDGMDTIAVDDVIKFHSPVKMATLVKVRDNSYRWCFLCTIYCVVLYTPVQITEFFVNLSHSKY